MSKYLDENEKEVLSKQLSSFLKCNHDLEFVSFNKINELKSNEFYVQVLMSGKNIIGLEKTSLNEIYVSKNKSDIENLHRGYAVVVKFNSSNVKCFDLTTIIP